MTTISGAGPHGAVLSSDRVPASKSGNKGYHEIGSIKDWVFSQIVDVDTALAANSDLKVPSQKAIKAYVDALIGANDALVYKGAIDCSTNPNYPAASAGHLYKVSVAGKIGGASGPNVEVGDTLICFADGTAAGNHATVGASWNIIQTNIDGTAALGAANVFTNALNSFRGRVHVDLGYVAYDEFSSVLGSGIKLSASSNITVAASKELAGIRWDQTLILGSGANAQLVSFNLIADATSHATSNLYGVIGLLDNAGPGSTKALYGRVRALTGCTGVLVAGAYGVNTVSGISAAYGIQIANDTDSGTAITSLIWGVSNTASATLSNYGVLFDATVSFGQAAFAACAVGAGDLIRLRNSTNSATVFAISSAGRITAANGLSPHTDDGAALGDTTHNWSDIFLASGAVINFNNGDVTVTHSANTLTFGGASSGYKFDAAVLPNSSDGAALGSASLMFSDLFLASGAVINFNNGGVTLTHDNTNDWLELAAGDLKLAAEKAIRLSGARQWIWQGVSTGDYFRVLVEGVGDALKIYGDGSSVESQFDLKIITGKRLNTIDSQTTVGAAGGASALPATPTGYFKMKVNGTERVVPFYAAA